MQAVDVLVVGGGPAGSTCARFLRRAGLDVVVVDAAEFPRVKLCAGWLSEPVWDELELRATDYPGRLWRWERCHVHFRGRQYTAAQRGYFIRRYELDEYLLRSCGARVVQGHRVKQVVRDGAGFLVDDTWRARFVVGAGGTHCPVSRALFGERADRPVGAQELEFVAGEDAVAAARLGRDGEPELVLHDDLRGYAWNIPKREWLNVGAGTLEARAARQAMDAATEHFFAAGHLPEAARDPLASPKGHSYYLFREAALARAHAQGAFLVGDALGVSQPMTAEGILPSIVSGRVCAQAIIDAADYPRRLAAHPVFADYRTIGRFMSAAGAFASGRSGASSPARRALRASLARTMPAWSRLADPVVAAAFAWMFAGKPLPGRRVLDAVDALTRRGPSSRNGASHA